MVSTPTVSPERVVHAQENCAPVHAAKLPKSPPRSGNSSVTTAQDKLKQQQHALAPVTMTMTMTPRRALQPIDANRMASQPARSPAPLSGLKRKHDASQLQQTPARPAKQQQQRALSPAFERDTESENLAWLDMLVALLERKYRNRSIPVAVDTLEAARQFEPRTRSQLLQPSTAPLAIAVGKDSTGSSGAGGTEDATRESHEHEKEQRRLRILLRHAQQIQDSSVASSTCCGCKTGCLKMYCVCFSTRGYCHASCACDDCKNSRQHKAQRVEAIQSYLANDPRAFSFASQQPSASTAGFLHLLPQKSSSVVLRGCRCKKSKCLKKYCECYQNGVACTAHCRCVECSNDPKSAHHLHRHRLAAAAQHARAFHEVHLTVTKKPKRNYVQKSIRLAL